MVQDPPCYRKPERRLATVEIPGRSGTCILRGAECYEDVVYALPCALRPGYPEERVWEWLRGRGRLILSTMPDFELDGRVDDEYTTSQQFTGHPGGYRLFTVNFICAPHRYEAFPDPAFEPKGCRRNHGTLHAAPLLHAVADGGTSLFFSVEDGEGKRELRVDVPGDGEQHVMVDMENESAWVLGVTRKRCHTSGDFWLICPGAYTLDYRAEGGKAPDVSIQPRYRYL